MEAADESAVEATSEEMEKQQEPVEEVESEIQVPSRSKWEEMEPAEDKLNKLDGIRLMKGKRKRQESPPLHLSDDDDDPYDEREEDMRIGKEKGSVGGSGGEERVGTQKKDRFLYRYRLELVNGSSSGNSPYVGIEYGTSGESSKRVEPQTGDHDKKSDKIRWDFFI
ncbi:uncharacterized protein LOC111329488 [Stylophora pistillata]|uniref:uncharacterized protein LOC111329488 n=1 Tax=Stylophora pistillata TaxID=50429 RepID=UPI000C03ED24|nr:uncharacterized protein LOC111329488 [Stylophora pistillata]